MANQTPPNETLSHHTPPLQATSVDELLEAALGPDGREGMRQAFRKKAQENQKRQREEAENASIFANVDPDVRQMLYERSPSLISKIWHNDFPPQGGEECDHPEMQKYLSCAKKLQENLLARLPDHQKETLITFVDLLGEYYSLAAEEAFSYGFRTGVNLMMEVAKK